MFRLTCRMTIRAKEVSWSLKCVKAVPLGIKEYIT
jgi:hypothetical protein